MHNGKIVVVKILSSKNIAWRLCLFHDLDIRKAKIKIIYVSEIFHKNFTYSKYTSFLGNIQKKYGCLGNN